MDNPLISIKGLKNRLGGEWIHTDVNLQVAKEEILGIIGVSGSGKTTLLKNLLLLLEPADGELKIFGQDLKELSPEQADHLRQRWGVLFQHSALFSALTVAENIIFPIHEFTTLPLAFMRQLALFKISLVGLPLSAAEKFPAELSGGMLRRAAAARALAMDPELLFLDEPTTGLDPKSAREFDKLLLFLRETLHLTIVMISHDLASLKEVTDRVAFMGEGKILAVAPLGELMKNPHPLIVDYFSKL